METAGNLADAQPIPMILSTEFAGLYESHHALIYCTALRITGNPSDAEDVLQTVFLRVLNQGERFNESFAREAYFRRAAVNASLDLLRRRVSHNEIHLDEKAAYLSIESTALLKERLRRAIASLDPNDAAIFLLRYVEGLSNGELAELFGQEKNNIAVRLHRIRQVLQVEMER
jgi:RNA polymerase sigma-70 factor, ECF subfamily